ncbi:MAG: hypothetical protein IJ024_04665 [Lachnospiraceae bacterium]|nr:hypothetical protein [Lachnospiraceae bacterium]
MKKSLSFGLILAAGLLLTGCGGKFEPTESTVYITSKGTVQSAIMESFDKAYYNFEELSGDVEKEVKSYCLDKNEEAITVESLTQEGDQVTLIMNYQTVEDYTAFNEVLLFDGTYAEAVEEGYVPEELFDAEGQSVNLDMEELGEYKVVVTEESVCIQISGKIKYTSDNVTIVDKKLARALEAGVSHPAFVLYK